MDENDAAQLGERDRSIERLGSVSETEAAVSDAVRRLRADARAQSELAMSLYASLQAEKRQAEEVQLGYLQQQQFVERAVQDALVAIRQEQAARDRQAAEAIARAEAAEVALRERSRLGNQQLEA